MSPNGNDPAEPFEEKKDGTVDETAQTSQNDKDAKKGKNNVLQMAFCLSFDVGLEIWPETSWNYMYERGHISLSFSSLTV